MTARARGTASLAACLALLGAAGCGGGRSRVAASAGRSDDGAARAAIAAVLDDVNDAARKADEPRYFAHYAADAVFLGTDATERWDLPAFRAYAHPHFARGKGWNIRPVRRAITLGGTDLAWFDEDVESSLGPARGSGVLRQEGGVWKVVQYNLALTVPNAKAAALRKLLAQ